MSDSQGPPCCQLIIACLQCCYSSPSFCILIGPPGINMPSEPKEWISNGGILGICDRHCGRFYREGSLRRQTPWQPSTPLTCCGWPYRGVWECELTSNELLNFTEKQTFNFANYNNVLISFPIHEYVVTLEARPAGKMMHYLRESLLSDGAIGDWRLLGWKCLAICVLGLIPLLRAAITLTPSRISGQAWNDNKPHTALLFPYTYRMWKEKEKKPGYSHDCPAQESVRLRQFIWPSLSLYFFFYFFCSLC